MSLSNISIEQPPEGTDPALTEYLTRQAEQVSSVFTGADIFVQRHTMPLKYSEGTVINFGSAIDPDITEPGLWLYTNDAWVQIATGDTNVIPTSDVIPEDLTPSTLIYITKEIWPEIPFPGLWLYVDVDQWLMLAPEVHPGFLTLPINEYMPISMSPVALVYFGQAGADRNEDITEPGLWMQTSNWPIKWVLIAPEEPPEPLEHLDIASIQLTGLTEKPDSQYRGALAFFRYPVGGSNPITNAGLWTVNNGGYWDQITVGGKLKARYYAPQAFEKERCLLAYFARPIPGEGIDQEGLYVYKSTGWAFIA